MRVGVDAHPVDIRAVCAAAHAARVDAQVLLGLQEVTLRGYPRDAWLQRGQRQGISAHERQVLDPLSFDDRGNVRALGLDDGRFASDLYFLGEVAGLQNE
jgi:hypothetical protein